MLRLSLLFKLAGAVGTAVALVGVAAVIVTRGPVASPSQEAAPTGSPGHTGDAALDALVDSLLNDDVAELEARFGGINARAGAVLGGPIGLYQPQELPTAEWASRLGSSERSLHAVVKDPREPFEWWDQPSPGIPRAAIFSAPRDFDIVLIVGPTDGARRPWRFSVAGGRVIDIVIDTGEDPGGSERPLVRALGYLTPSPDDEPGRFLVLPPHEMRPAPPGIGFAKGQSPRAPVRSPSIAPDGRTGDAALDALIDRLLSADASTLGNVYAALPAAQERCDPSCDRIRVSPAAWTSRLAAGTRSLYAVFTGDPADAEVILAVQSGTSPAEAWQFGVLGGRLAEIDIFMPQPVPAGAKIPLLHVARGTPSPARDYERFYVLPPQSDLPQPPRAHPLSARTGASGIDALLTTLEAQDTNGLLAAFADPGAPLVRQCAGAESKRDAAYAASWARETGAQIYGVHSVAHLPTGYEPRADHLLIAFRQLKPYWWEAMGILERRGEIIGLITSESGCSPEAIYPPARYVVPPPVNGLAGLDPTRRSGIASIDAILDAAAARDEAAMTGLISYRQVACGDASGAPPGAGPPACPQGAAPGTPVDILPVIICHGGHFTRDQAPKGLIEMITRDAPFGLYAVVGAPPDRIVAIASQRGGAVALTMNERGVTSVSAGCGPWHPDVLIGGGQPSFLLPPR